METLFDSIIPYAGITVSVFLICFAVSLVLGFAIAFTFMAKNRFSSNLLMTLAMIPAVVQVVIMLVNGNLGTGVAVAGAFSLVRFRSAPGNAKEITAIFLAVAAGLATGTGYLAIAVIFTVVTCLIVLLLSCFRFGERRVQPQILRITIPENLDYNGLFDDLFDKFTSQADLVSVKTANMGSMFRLRYEIVLKDARQEKELIDALRCRNGNLEIMIGRQELSGIAEL